MEQHQAQFTPIKQLPLDLVARVEANGRGQGQGETDVKAGLLSARADGLDFQRIGGGLHFFIFFSN
jgi:hypothetical protein